MDDESRSLPAEPSVGNVLGFALEFHQRRALLKLQRRRLSSGVLLSDFEAEIPGVQFPVEHPISVSRYRNRRCRAKSMSLRFDAPHLQRWLRSRLVGATISAHTIDDAVLYLRGSTTFQGADAWLELRGRGERDHPWTGLFGLRLGADGRHIVVETIRSWIFGEGPDEPRKWCNALTPVLLDGIGPANDHKVTLDPLSASVSHGFARVGWKVPDIEGLKLARTEVNDDGIGLAYRSDVEPARSSDTQGPYETPDEIAQSIAAAREGLRSGRYDLACDQFRTLLESLQSFRPGRLACIQWFVRAVRHRPEVPADATLEALATWLRHEPRNPVARRWYVEALSRSGRIEELARFTQTTRAGAELPVRQARLDLGVASLMLDHLGDRARARAILAPWLEQLERTPELDQLRVPIRVALARARADTPRAALKTLDDALSEVDSAPARAAARLRLALTLIEVGAAEHAIAALRKALAEDPTNPELDEAAQRLAITLGPGASDDAEARPASDDSARRIIAMAAVRRDEADALDLLDAALEERPDDAELLQAAARLAAGRAELERASGYLLRLRSTTDDPAIEARLRLARTDVLVRLEQHTQVWSELAPVMTRADIEARAHALRWAVEYAPTREAMRFVDALVDEVSVAATIEALEARWSRWNQLDSAATTYVALLESDGQFERARAVCLDFAARCDGEGAVTWLLRAAARASKTDAVDLLERAFVVSGGDSEVEELLERALRDAGALGRLRELWTHQALEEERPRGGRVRALDRLIAYHVGDDEPVAAGRGNAELVDLCRRRFTLDPSHSAVNFVLADDARRTQDVTARRDHLARGLELLGPDDPRRTAPALELARLRLEEGEFAAARELVESVTRTGGSVDAWPLLAKIARLMSDDTLLAAALEASLRHVVEPLAEAQTRLELAGVLRGIAREEEALRHLEAAAEVVEPRSSLHLEIAEAWLDATRGRQSGAQQEAQARRELRSALAGELPPAEVRAEALLWADRLDDVERGLELLDAGLRDRPDHERLLSTFKDLCLRTSDQRRYLAALRSAIEVLSPGRRRDVLIVELATTAVDLDAPGQALDALDRLSAETATSAEALDLRDWAVSRLGREDAELEAIERRLEAAPDDPSALVRLERVVGNPVKLAEHLLRIAANQPTSDAAALVRRAVEALRGEHDPTVLHRLLRRALDHGIPLDEALTDEAQVWKNALAGAIMKGDEALAADFVSVARDPRAPVSLREAAEEGLDDALAALVDAPHLLHLLWSHADAEANPEDFARSRVSRIAKRGQLDARSQARLLVGLAEHLPAPRAAELLARHALEALDDAGPLDIYVDALQRLGHVPQVLRLLEKRLERALTDEDRVVLLKRLAHLYSDAASDPERAAEALTQALEWAPDDPDLLLPLLDHAFEQHDLPQAVRLANRVLENVSMGAAACVALAHRAADAALAIGDPETAASLLRLAAQQDPSDDRTERRLAEVEEMRGNPTQRIGLLGIIADRQSGPARWEALEEKARLLADPLGRPDEAISTLELLLSEAPDHPTAIASLQELYPAVQRWRDLAQLLESLAPRQHGVERCETLRRLGHLFREHLFDAPRAEHALRVALDHLGDAPETLDLAESMRRELVADVEAQGRFVDLSIYLERALEPELAGMVNTDDLHPDRAVLLVQLARIYRGPLDDEEKAGRVYERLEQLGRLPDEGLATLARVYHRTERHADLVRILAVRSKALGEEQEWLRKATVDQRIAELLEGPLGRPHEAAPYYLDAYLADPRHNVHAGARARVLLSGTDAVVNVRAELRRRLPGTAELNRPTLLTLLGDILGPHEEYEAEAEAAYREALGLSPEHGPAQEALGRLLARQGRLKEAAGPLVDSARNPATAPPRAAENAAIAARALLELGRAEQAEAVLKAALQRAPDSQRALLELARLYERGGRPTEQAIVLESLSELPLSSMLGAEVAYRRATLLLNAAREDAYSSEAERARAYLLEAVSSDAKHAAARQALLELASARLEWSVVAHMHYLAIREQPAGPARARTHLELAQTYLDHLGDHESAARNIESALAQASDELMTVTRAGQLAVRLPDPRAVAERFESLASSAPNLADGARARLWLLAADLRMTDDDVNAAEAASQRVLDLREPPEGAVAAARRNLDALAVDDERDLRQQKSGLMKLLDSETAAAERAHILGRLRDVGLGLGDPDLADWAGREQLSLARTIEGEEVDIEAALASLRDVLVERGAYEDLVMLLERCATSTTDASRSAELMREAAEYAWTGLQSTGRTLELLERCVDLDPRVIAASKLPEEVADATDDPAAARRLFSALQRIPATERTPSLDLRAASLAIRAGRPRDGLGLLRPLSVQRHDDETRLRALRELDTLLSRTGTDMERLPVLRRYFDEVLAYRDEEATNVGRELVECEQAAGDLERALEVCDRAIDHDGDATALHRLRAKLLEQLERWEDLAEEMEAIATQAADPNRLATGLVSAARIWLERLAGDPNLHRRTKGQAEARRVLMLACDVAPDLAEPRALLIPVEFSAGRWDAVLRCGVELRELGDDDDERLILVALTQAFRHGGRSLARDLGFRHSDDAHHRVLFPALRQLLMELATSGPLPRLDTILAAAAALCGGRQALDRSLRRWAAGKPLQAGLALGLARLSEADGRAELARALYQLVAFMLPDGPVPAVVGRLPLPRPPADMTADPGGPLARGNVVRAALVRARSALAGTSSSGAPGSDSDSTRFALADTILEPFRRHLGLPLPLHSVCDGGVGVEVRNTKPPSIVLGPAATDMRVSELRFRLAHATTTIAMGLAIVDAGDATLAELLDGLGRMATPGHEPTGPGARKIATLVSVARLHRRLSRRERHTLVAALRHWLTAHEDASPLQAELSRLQIWFATRLSGQLDGALSYLASELGLALNTGVPDPVATLRTEQAQWLLRGLEVYSAR